ncbi:MAG: CopG family transcriptional regulator [Candidatus Omnitrophica bacterium CG11_big_fil_rev_8_21_14_0_20_64_10]|nr:MAG: CopG family transcriptional regulator [Candidatus Omnitrophica bacterium CG11_big_fil_rev_8_21_14_0_20_64_10]
MKAAAFDAAFDRGETVAGHLDLAGAKARYPVQRINVDIPRELLEKVDREAARVGVPRTSLIKVWIAERLERTGT